MGYPISQDFDYSELKNFLTVHINNIGDPFIEGSFEPNTKCIEREVLKHFARMFHFPDI